MRKAICISLMVLMILSICSCNIFMYDLTPNSSVNEQIVEVSVSFMYFWDVEDGRSFSVINEGDGYYSVDANGEWYRTRLRENDISKAEKTNAVECQESVTELFELAKATVFEYIDETDFFKDKDELKNYISSVQVRFADFSLVDGEECDVEYDAEQDAVFINKKYETLCAERMTYALICALMHETKARAGIDDPYPLIDRAVALMISDYTFTCPFEDCGDRCTYERNMLNQYGYVRLYLGCTKEDGIEAAFYGYDDILPIIPKDELDVFHSSLRNVGESEDDFESEDDIIIICNCVNQWIIEEKESNPLSGLYELIY